jgi:hypothetical protein
MRRKSSRRIMKLVKSQMPNNGLKYLENGQCVNVGYKGICRRIRKDFTGKVKDIEFERNV